MDVRLEGSNGRGDEKIPINTKTDTISNITVKYNAKNKNYGVTVTCKDKKYRLDFDLMELNLW